MEHSLGIVVVVAGGIGVLALLRRLSRPVEAASLEPPKISTLPVPSPVEEADSSRLRIRKHYFRGFDSDSGPPDADCFYDEFFIELESADTPEIWRQSYFVGTPSGIAQAMREENWDYMLGNDLLIVRRFDMDLILRAVMEHIEERYEIAPEIPKDPHLG